MTRKRTKTSPIINTTITTTTTTSTKNPTTTPRSTKPQHHYRQRQHQQISPSNSIRSTISRSATTQQRDTLAVLDELPYLPPPVIPARIHHDDDYDDDHPPPTTKYRVDTLRTIKGGAKRMIVTLAKHRRGVKVTKQHRRGGRQAVAKVTAPIHRRRSQRRRRSPTPTPPSSDGEEEEEEVSQSPPPSSEDDASMPPPLPRRRTPSSYRTPKREIEEEERCVRRGSYGEDSSVTNRRHRQPSHDDPDDDLATSSIKRRRRRRHYDEEDRWYERNTFLTPLRDESFRYHHTPSRRDDAASSSHYHPLPFQRGPHPTTPRLARPPHIPTPHRHYPSDDMSDISDVSLVTPARYHAREVPLTPASVTSRRREWEWKRREYEKLDALQRDLEVRIRELEGDVERRREELGVSRWEFG